jgi:hypothetical protein
MNKYRGILVAKTYYEVEFEAESYQQAADLSRDIDTKDLQAYDWELTVYNLDEVEENIK